MSFAILPLSANSDTFGVWLDRTNEVIEALEETISVGDSITTNANGNIYINGNVSSTDTVLTDNINPLGGAGGIITVDGSIHLTSNIVSNSATDTAISHTFENAGTETFKFQTAADHSYIELTSADGNHYIRLTPNSNTISGSSGMQFTTDLIPELAASKITSGTFATARIPSLSASKITSGTLDVARIPTLTPGKISAGEFSGDFTFDSGSIAINNANDGSILLDLLDTSTAGSAKIMMRLQGLGNNLEVRNNDGTGDYEFRTGTTQFRLNDATGGFALMHRNASDPNGFDGAFDGGYPDTSPPFSLSSATGTVEATFRVPTAFEDRLTGIDILPPGCVMPFARSTAPEGWLEANGNAVPNGSGTVQGKTADFSALYDAVDTNFGVAGTLPDLRGEFLRGWNNRPSTGPDAGRTFGSNQAEEVGPHTHTANTSSTVRLEGGSTFINGFVEDVGNGTGSVDTNTGAENRPRNVALLYCIKY